VTTTIKKVKPQKAESKKSAGRKKVAVKPQKAANSGVHPAPKKPAVTPKKASNTGQSLKKRP
jgi:hypothetical protein